MVKFSYSSMETYKTCPLQYKLSKIDRVEPEGTTIEAYMGSAVHATLEKLYKDLINGKLDTLQDLIEFYAEEWKKGWDGERIRIVKKEYTPENYFEVGKKCISAYYKKFYPFDQAIPIWVEKEFTIDLGEGIEVTGFIDRVDKAGNGRYEIHDYKTTGSLPDRDECEEDDQLAIYQLALQEQFEDVKEVRLVWHYLRFDTERETKRSPEQLEVLKGKIRALATEIMNQKEFEPRSSALCDWCLYWKYCPLKRHALSIEDFGPEEISHEEGYNLATRYGELLEKIKELDSELEIVKKKLLDYAKVNNYMAIQGRDYEIRIREYDNLTLPEKNSPDYEMLKNAILNEGLFELLEIDRFKLSQKVKNAQISPGLAKAVNKVCTFSKTTKFTPVTKKKEYTL